MKRLYQNQNIWFSYIQLIYSSSRHLQSPTCGRYSRPMPLCQPANRVRFC